MSVFNDTITELDLSDQNLTELSSEIGNCVNLKILQLQNNKLTTLPKEIGKCKNLGILYLYNNQLTELPKEIGNCRNLKELYLHNNQLLILPSEIGNCTKLKELGLQNNNLIEIPKEIGKCINLRILYLQNNKLTTLPEEICNCVKLDNLKLHENLLIKISQEIPKFAIFKYKKLLHEMENNILAIKLQAKLERSKIKLNKVNNLLQYLNLLYSEDYAKIKEEYELYTPYNQTNMPKVQPKRKYNESTNNPWIKRLQDEFNKIHQELKEKSNFLEHLNLLYGEDYKKAKEDFEQYKPFEKISF